MSKGRQIIDAFLDFIDEHEVGKYFYINMELFSLWSAVRGADFKVDKVTNDALNEIKSALTCKIRDFLLCSREKRELDTKTCQIFSALEEWYHTNACTHSVHYITHLLDAFDTLVKARYAKRYTRIPLDIKTHVKTRMEIIENGIGKTE